MGITLRLMTDSGEIMHELSDSYGPGSMLNVINDTLNLEPQQRLSWANWTDKYYEGVDRLNPEYALRIHNQIIPLFAELASVYIWRAGSTGLNVERKAQVSQFYCDLLKMLIFAAHGRYTLVWTA